MTKSKFERCLLFFYCEGRKEQKKERNLHTRTADIRSRVCIQPHCSFSRIANNKEKNLINAFSNAEIDKEEEEEDNNNNNNQEIYFIENRFSETRKKNDSIAGMFRTRSIDPKPIVNTTKTRISFDDS